MIHYSFLTSLISIDLISVTAHLLLHHKSRFHKDLQGSKSWTARFRQQNIPIHTSQVTVSHHLRTLTKGDSSNTSFTPPRSVMAGKEATQLVHFTISPPPAIATVSKCSSSIVDLQPLPKSAPPQKLWKRLGLDNTSRIHKSLLVRAHISLW
jgi:hypothetical protein